ncbi:hypothetical protein WICPIJ_006256 [Wickerhamomyces pijperi]|uniref:Uncharacterized protein n=1 Tax=Wickerhamomyces pijperi TaxID=599730 RepID=A0A9P8Q463_WICPI|nr:hypothetical protein WICPIJ_006256 [Wickerhamomyces pijperi]
MSPNLTSSKHLDLLVGVVNLQDGGSNGIVLGVRVGQAVGEVIKSIGNQSNSIQGFRQLNDNKVISDLHNTSWVLFTNSDVLGRFDNVSSGS